MENKTKRYTINKAYISNIDIELAKFKRTHERTASEAAEYQKYNDAPKGIYYRRDHVATDQSSEPPVVGWVNE